MCKSHLHDFLVALPKCEQHCHIEGTLEPDLLFQLAKRNHIDLPSSDDSFASPQALRARYDRFTCLDDFLSYYFIGMSCLVSEQDFEDLAWSYFRKAKDQGVVHAELFFDPQAHTARGIKFGVVLTGLENACSRASAQLSISSLLIPCFLRHLPLAESEKMWDEAIDDLQTKRLAGLGLSGSERGFPPENWGPIFTRAKELGIHRTAHAGEEGPVSFIEKALNTCHVQRIDHGIKLIDDVRLMDEVAQQSILVTVCPISNLKLRCVDSLDQLPIRKFLDAGVQFSINSDDPAYFTSYILDNYCAVQETFNLTIEDWLKISRAAASNSWCDEQRRGVILQMINETQLSISVPA